MKTGQENGTNTVMSLVIVNGLRPWYELHSPRFSKAKGSMIVLTVEQMVNPNQIVIEALKQASYPLTQEFVKAWKDGLYEQLVFNAECRDALPGEKPRRKKS